MTPRKAQSKRKVRNKKGGAPSKFTAARRSRILALLRKGLGFDQVAQAVGIHPKTLYAWLHDGEAQKDAGKARFYDEVYQAVADAELVKLDELGELAAGCAWTERRVEKDVPILDRRGRVVDTYDRVTEVYKRDPKVYQWFLERRFNSRWGPRQEVHHEHTVRIKRLELGSGPDPTQAPIPRVIEQGKEDDHAQDSDALPQAPEGWDKAVPRDPRAGP